MARADDIQGNSWTDEPEIPNVGRSDQEPRAESGPDAERDGGGEEAERADDETWESGVAEQRPPSDS